MRDVFDAAKALHTFGHGDYGRDQERMSPLLPYSQIYVDMGGAAPSLMFVGPHAGMSYLLGRDRAQQFVGATQTVLKTEVTEPYRILIGRTQSYRDTVKTIAKLPGEGVTAFKYERLIIPFRIAENDRAALATFTIVTNKMKVVD